MDWNKEICELGKWGVLIVKDFNGARNILLRAMRDSSVNGWDTIEWLVTKLLLVGFVSEKLSDDTLKLQIPSNPLYFN